MTVSALQRRLQKKLLLEASLNGLLSINWVSAMALMCLTLMDLLMLGDQVDLGYRDENVLTGTVPATVMYGSMVRQPRPGLIDGQLVA